MNRYKGSEAGKGLMSFLKNWKKDMWLKGCELAWDEAGAAGRGFPAIYESPWRVLSRRGTGSDHSGCFWRMDWRGQEQNKRPVRRLFGWFWWQMVNGCGDGEKWMHLRYNLEVILIGWSLGFWHEQLCRWNCLQSLHFKRFCIPRIPHTRSPLSHLSATTLLPSHCNYSDHVPFN